MCKLSYDYIDGITLEEYLRRTNDYTFNDQVIILIQLLKINKKLFNVGIYLYDQHLNNFIVDDNEVTN